MNKTLLILRNDFINVISRRSFYLTLFLVPLISFIVFSIIATLGKGMPSLMQDLFTSSTTDSIDGYVDQSGLIQSLPGSVTPGSLIAFASEAEARAALQADEIDAFYRVPADYIEIGTVYYVRKDFNPVSGSVRGSSFFNVLHYNLLKGDQAFIDRLENPVTVEHVNLKPVENEREQSNPLTFFIPYVVTMLLYMIIMSSASYMLSSITTEKQNRVLEIILVSVTPAQMLTGKIIALGLAGLIQTVLWSSAGILLLRLTGRSTGMPTQFQIPFSFLLWVILFFLLGYALYASLMAAVGAMVPNLREASQASTFISIPLIATMLFINSLISDSNGTIAVILSLFPMSAPVAMLTRLAGGNVPIWQVILSAVLLFATCIVVVRSVAGLFRAQTLLAGQSFNLKLFIMALAGRA